MTNKTKELQIKAKKKAKEIKITYKQANMPKEEAQNGIDRAFDIIFEEVVKKP